MVGRGAAGADANALARFYSQVLGWPLVRDKPGWAVIAPQGTVFYTAFSMSPEYVPPVWLCNGECFSVLVRLLGRFAPIELRVPASARCDECPGCGVPASGERVDCPVCFEWVEPENRQLNLRPWAAGLTLSAPMSSGMIAFILLVLTGVTFDGIEATTRWTNLIDSLFSSQGTLDVTKYYLIQTAGQLTIWAIFGAVYFAFCTAIRAVAAVREPLPCTAGRFIVSIVPIALAYEIAHYFTLLGLQGQLIYSLISDPFGRGWNLFGTAGTGINGKILSGLFFNGAFVWYTEIALIVVGHVIAVYRAHTIAGLSYRARVIRSQLPMLVLMVAYTMTSLWIIAQPLIEEK